MTIVEAGRTVIGGVDTHLDVHVAAALDPIGGVLGVESFVASPQGYTAMLEWMGAFGTVSKVGVEGTGAYGAGLGRFLAKAGVQVVEVDRPNRQARRSKGKSDSADAVEAARAVLSGRATGTPKSRDGNVEAIRALLVAKRSARDARLRALHQMRQLSYTGPDQLRSRLKDLSITELVAETAAMRPRSSGDPVVYATKVSLAALGRRVLSLEDELVGIDELLTTLVTTCAPEMLELDRRIHSAEDLAGRRLPAHERRLAARAWDLGADETLEHLHLRRYAHVLGYGGHFPSKSRRYSTTFGSLRGARVAWREAHRTRRDEHPECSYEATWLAVGIGWANRGEAACAEQSREAAAYARRLARESEHDDD